MAGAGGGEIFVYIILFSVEYLYAKSYPTWVNKSFLII